MLPAAAPTEVSVAALLALGPLAARLPHTAPELARRPGVAAILRDLHPPRLPEDFAAFGWPEALAAFGLGLLVAVIVFAVIRPALSRRPRPNITARLLYLRALPPDERLLAQTRLLARLGGTLPEDLRPDLYRPDAAAIDSTARLEALIRAALRKADRAAKAGLHV